MGAVTAYRVVEGTQVHYDGETYTGGQTVPFAADVDPGLIRFHVNAGWVEPVSKTARKAS